MKHSGIKSNKQLEWSASGIFWMRSAGFPAAWLETGSYTGCLDDENAIESWFHTDRLPLLKDFVAHTKYELLREAIGLLNPNALDRIIGLADADLSKINNRVRQRLRLYWMYMQRLCAKNDTCSFFGPISWGRINSTKDCIQVIDDRPDADRRIFFEHWFVQRLADILSKDLYYILPLSLNPGVRISENRLLIPVDQQVMLKVFQKADLLRVLAQQDSGDPVRLARCDAPAFLEKMVLKGVVVAKILVPTVHKYPLDWLAEFLQHLPDSPKVRMWQRRIDKLEDIKRAATCKKGASRASNLHTIAEAANEWGVDLSRRSGAMYIGRYPTYEDAHRQVELCLSSKTIDDLQADLAPLMSAYTQLVDHVSVDLDKTYAALVSTCADEGAEQVSLLSFLKSLSHAEDVTSPVINRLRSLYCDHWVKAQTYALASSESEIVFDASGLNAFFKALPHPERIIPTLPWRYVHSPDVMLMAKQSSSTKTRDFQFTIGETHPGIYTVGQHVAAPFCQNADTICRDLVDILPVPTIVMCDPPQCYQRSNINLPDAGAFYELVLPWQSSRLPPDRTIDAANCKVEVTTTCVELVVPEKGFRVPLLMVMSGHLHKILFQLSGDLIGKYRPERMRIGKTIFKRRSWEIAGTELPNVQRPAENYTCFVRMLRWVRQRQLPRFVFAVIPGEPKPIYVDFQNPLSIDAFVKLAINASKITLSEMLPAHDDLLFEDSLGKFTAEFRMSFIKRNKQHE